MGVLLITGEMERWVWGVSGVSPLVDTPWRARGVPADGLQERRETDCAIWALGWRQRNSSSGQSCQHPVLAAEK